jgi:hypothetical protein
VLAKARPGIRFNDHIEGDGPTVFAHACKMGLEGIVGDLNTENRDCGDPAFSGANALRIVRAGCERNLIKEAGRPC